MLFLRFSGERGQARGGHEPPDRRDGRKAKNCLWRILTFHACLALTLTRLKKRKKKTAILQIILTLVFQATKSKNYRNLSLITLKSATTYPPEIRRVSSVTMAFPFGLNQRICLTSHSLILSMNILKPSLVVILFKPKT